MVVLFFLMPFFDNILSILVGKDCRVYIIIGLLENGNRMMNRETKPEKRIGFKQVAKLSAPVVSMCYSKVTESVLIVTKDGAVWSMPARGEIERVI